MVWSKPEPIAPVVAEVLAVAVTAAAAQDAPLSRRAARACTAPTPVIEPVAEEFELIEPEIAADEAVEAVEPEASVAPEFSVASESSAVHDEFEAAARLFSFTGETPVQAPPAPKVEPEQPAHTVTRGTSSRRTPGVAFKRITAASFSMGAMTIAGLLAVGMTTPASALAAPINSGVQNPATSISAGVDDVPEGEIQAYVAPAEVDNADIDRAGGYAIASLADIAKEDDIVHTSSAIFTNDPTAAIQWPFPVGVPMSYGWGMRWGRMHTGIDLTPGNGAKIQAIADGVVRSVSNATGGYGVNIYIDHIIDGKLVTSHYAHMQYGSPRVKAGEHVKVGQIIGVVGNTGHSFGAHLHFEILLNGTQLINPLPWMQANAGRHSLD